MDEVDDRAEESGGGLAIGDHDEGQDDGALRELDVKIEMNVLTAQTQTDAQKTSAVAVQVGAEDATNVGVPRSEARQIIASPGVEDPLMPAVNSDVASTTESNWHATIDGIR